MKYMIAVVRTGCLFVEAETEEAAMHIADHQKTDTVSWSDDWKPTDCEVDDSADACIKECAFD